MYRNNRLSYPLPNPTHHTLWSLPDTNNKIFLKNFITQSIYDEHRRNATFPQHWFQWRNAFHGFSNSCVAGIASDCWASLTQLDHRNTMWLATLVTSLTATIEYCNQSAVLCWIQTQRVGPMLYKGGNFCRLVEFAVCHVRPMCSSAQSSIGALGK